MSKIQQEQVTARSAPFGTVYFGAILAIIGMIVATTPAALIGALIVLSGVMLICTGLILRAISRIG